METESNMETRSERVFFFSNIMRNEKVLQLNSRHQPAFTFISDLHTFPAPTEGVRLRTGPQSAASCQPRVFSS